MLPEGEQVIPRDCVRHLCTKAEAILLADAQRTEKGARQAMMILKIQNPMHTKIYKIAWRRLEYQQMSPRYRQIRSGFNDPMDTCYFCHYKFLDGEMMSLAHVACVEKIALNKILCQKCYWRVEDGEKRSETTVEDTIYQNTDINLDFADRLRVLVHGRLRVEAEVDCEYLPGNIVGRARTHIPKLISLVHQRFFPRQSWVCSERGRETVAWVCTTEKDKGDDQ